ncbi:MAG TPA: hypothetical protein VIV09_16770 [Pseudolabrys sp.]
MKPKGIDKVGFLRARSAFETLAEMDIRQPGRYRSGPNTWSSGHIPRQLGLARMATPKGPIFFIYTHSQVSNGGAGTQYPPAFVGFNKDQLEWLTAQLLRVMSEDA